jgi:hypothetical protein
VLELLGEQINEVKTQTSKQERFLEKIQSEIRERKAFVTLKDSEEGEGKNEQRQEELTQQMVSVL